MPKPTGNSMISTGRRIYKYVRDTSTKKVEAVLLTWRQPVCQKCKRFLSKKQIKFCAKCKPLNDREVSTRTMKARYHNDSEFRAEEKLRDYVCRHVDEISVGDIV
jgi:hypothetical protein